jgi:hypothetical protein
VEISKLLIIYKLLVNKSIFFRKNWNERTISGIVKHFAVRYSKLFSKIGTYHIHSKSEGDIYEDHGYSRKS